MFHIDVILRIHGIIRDIGLYCCDCFQELKGHVDSLIGAVSAAAHTGVLGVTTGRKDDTLSLTPALYELVSTTTRMVLLEVATTVGADNTFRCLAALGSMKGMAVGDDEVGSALAEPLGVRTDEARVLFNSVIQTTLNSTAFSVAKPNAVLGMGGSTGAGASAGAGK